MKLKWVVHVRGRQHTPGNVTYWVYGAQKDAAGTYMQESLRLTRYPTRRENDRYACFAQTYDTKADAEAVARLVPNVWHGYNTVVRARPARRIAP